MIIIPLLPRCIFQRVKYQSYCRVKSLLAYIRGLAGIFSIPYIYPTILPFAACSLGIGRGREGGRERGATSRPFIFIEAFQEGRKAGEREREREIHPPWRKTTREIWSLFDNVHLIRSALCEGGVGLEVKGGEERGRRTLAETRSFEGVLPPLWEGWKMSARPSETLISCSIPAYLFRDLLTYPPTYLHAHHS